MSSYLTFSLKSKKEYRCQSFYYITSEKDLHFQDITDLGPSLCYLIPDRDIMDQALTQKLYQRGIYQPINLNLDINWSHKPQPDINVYERFVLFEGSLRQIVKGFNCLIISFHYGEEKELHQESIRINSNSEISKFYKGPLDREIKYLVLSTERYQELPLDPRVSQTMNLLVHIFENLGFPSVLSDVIFSYIALEPTIS